MNEPAPHPSPVALRTLLPIAALCVALPLTGNAQAPAYRVADINTQPIVRSSSPRQFHAAGGLALFVADGDPGPTLWRTDGSAAGTLPLLAPVAGDIAHIADLGDALLLVLDDGNARALWRSDGTAAGTVRLKSIPHLNPWSTPTEYAVVGGALFFLAGDQSTGHELWKSDGSAAGTGPVADLLPGPESSLPTFLGSAGGLLLFSAHDAIGHAARLWRTDGTRQGTAPIGDVGVWSGARGATRDGVVYFTASVGLDVVRAELWRTDGTAAETAPVAPGVAAWNLVAAGDRVFFTGYTEAGGTALWQSDGSGAGTAMVTDFTPGPGSNGLRMLAAVGDGLLFHQFDDTEREHVLWHSDGTAAGTQPVAVLPGAVACSGAAVVNGAAVMVIDGVLWRSDGTAAGTAPLASVAATHDCRSGSPFARTPDGVVFSSDGADGVELWRSDGTAAGTGPLANLAPDIDAIGSNPRVLTAVGDALYFVADDGRHGDELWTSDGTTAGTRLVADLQPGASSSLGYYYPALTPFGDRLAFVAYGVGGPALWLTDGTETGTERLTNAADAGTPAWLTNVNGTLYFTAGNGSGGSTLWRSDGTAAGTRRVRHPLLDTTTSAAGNLTALGDEVYFSLDSVLWRSDGSDQGTDAVRDLGGFISRLAALSPVDATLFIVVMSPTPYGDPYYVELWNSDGTAAGTARFASIDDAYVVSSSSGVDDGLFFVPSTFVWGRGQLDLGLWWTDGTAAGTRLVAPLNGGAGVYPVDLAGWLYFAHRGLWRASADGTQVDELAAVPQTSVLTAAGSHLLFLGCAPRTGGACGVWESDGTADGTRQVTTGTAPHSPLTIAGGRAFFTATEVETGTELWALPLDALGRCGNGAVDAGEECDGGAPAACERDCSLPVCGDGRLNTEAGEACDDGNRIDHDCCSATCGVAAAGHPCVDADLCDGSEACDGAGACAAGGPLDCDDHDPHTADACSWYLGCQHSPITRCVGDCDRDRVVDVAELIAMVRALLSDWLPPCSVGDVDRNGRISVDEAVAALAHALDGCGSL